MGAEASTHVFHQVDGGRFHQASARARRSFIDHWKKRELVSQLFGVVRHTERADGIYSYFNGDRWSYTDDAVRWPLDPPLSDAGLDEAKYLGTEIKEFADSKKGEFHVVITSPYARCVQTAVAICKELASDVRLLVDLSLGEVFGPEVLGDSQPLNHLRPLDSIARFCIMEGVKCVFRPIGRQPIWPETLRDARRRFALRFISYLKRGQITRRNFLLVTHADCVGSVLGIMPDKQGYFAEKVDYGATLLAHRPTKLQASLRHINVSDTNDLSSVLPSTAFQEATAIEDLTHLPDLLEEQESGSSPGEFVQGSQSAGCPVEGTHPPQVQRAQTANAASVKDTGFDGSEKAIHGWTCETFNIHLKQKPDKVKPKLSKRISELIKFGPYSKTQVEKLLGKMPEETLGDQSTTVAATGSPQTARDSAVRHPTNLSSISLSTYLFGTNGDRDPDVASPVISHNRSPGVGFSRDSHDFGCRSSSELLLPPADTHVRHSCQTGDAIRRRTQDNLSHVGGHALPTPLSPLPNRSISDGSSQAIRCRRRNTLSGTLQNNFGSKGRCDSSSRLSRLSAHLPHEVISDDDHDVFKNLCQTGGLLLQLAASKEHLFGENFSEAGVEGDPISRKASTKESIRREQVDSSVTSVQVPTVVNGSPAESSKGEVCQACPPPVSPLFISLNKTGGSSLLQRRRAASKHQPLAPEEPADAALLN